MDRAVLQLLLAQAQIHIAEGAEYITKQESLIAEMNQDGHDTSEAKQLLATLREAQAAHVDGRDRILKELQH